MGLKKVAIIMGLSFVSFAVILNIVHIASSEPPCFIETSSGEVIDLTDELCSVDTESGAGGPPLTSEEIYLNRVIPLSVRRRIAELARRDPATGYALFRDALCRAQGYEADACPIVESNIIIPGADPTHRRLDLPN